MTDAAAAEAFVADVIAEFGTIDILINNAGAGMVGPAEQLSMQQVQDQLDINYLAPVRLTKLVLPHMRERGSGRIVTVTSVGGAVGQPFADAYCGAKFAVEGFMQSLAPVVALYGVNVRVVEPAAVASAFVDNAVRPEIEGPYAAPLAVYVSRTSTTFANAQSAESAGAAIVEAALDPEPVFRYQTSEAALKFVSVSIADTTGERVVGSTRMWIEPQNNDMKSA